MESLSLVSLWDRFLLGVGEFCVYVFPGWILVRLPTGLSSGLRLTSAEGPHCLNTAPGFPFASP